MEKEWVLKLEPGNKLEESQEGKQKLETVVGDSKPYKVYIVLSSYE